MFHFPVEVWKRQRMKSGYALTILVANFNAILITGGAKIRALKIGNNDFQTMQLFIFSTMLAS